MRLVLTCGACPEQYDVFDDEGQRVGYFRLRHGHFRAHFGDVDGPIIYESSTRGDGMFEDDEREVHSERAKDAIRRQLLSEGTQ
jgi:hypothetical protein